ncbi:acyl carrier protein [Streptomyces gamaensis]|uniref:Acyl carrier protein n=1 Tax=Streptomyces gamaensis TaxID=1763542 RepID=A0ABW0Z967_9ACTN
MTTTPATSSESDVLARITEVLHRLLDDCDPVPGGITPATRFVDDLDLESIDLVTLTGMLRAHYGEQVDFPGWFASLGLSEIARLTVGHLVRHIVDSLR